MKTIIFLSGIFLPKWIARSKLVWNSSQWSNYNCIWLDSKIPYSDIMVKQELSKLERLIKKYPNAILAGHSLGAWWISNLLCRQSLMVNKTILWTPLVNANQYPNL